ncbi:MAG: hypothetical protein MJZ34_02500 [Paludibacteraceae bacterium]|nr:hypothetical protein [Paludibacteraceae bacterium]
MSNNKRYNTDYDLSDLALEGKESARGEFITVCPICQANKEAAEPGRIYDKRKLYIDPTMSVGHCFVCETVFLDKTGLSKLKMQKTWVNLSVDEPEFISVPYTRPDQKNVESLNYLINRCPQLYRDLDFNKMGFCCSNEKVVIKFILKGQNYYYQLRYVNPEKSNNGVKYYMPVTGDLGKPLYFAGGSYNSFAPTILVEGVFTALVEKLLLPQVNVVAVLGHYLTPFQTSMLKSLGNFGPIYVHMDETKLSETLMRSMRRDFKNLHVIANYSDKLDSEELIRYNKITPDDYRSYLMNEMSKANRVLRVF